MSVYKSESLSRATKLVVWKIEESVEELIAKLKLSEEEQSLLMSFSSETRRLHWLAGRTTLKAALETDEFLEMDIDEHQKPYFLNRKEYFSLTHSFKFAGAIISNRPVGIDIEKISDKVMRVASKFLKAAEIEFIDAVYQKEHLTCCWTAKEAVYKLLGKKGVSLKDNITIAPFSFQEQGDIRVSVVWGAHLYSFVVSYGLMDKNYLLAYCVSE